MKIILKTKILLADDHRLMRDGLRSILEKQLDMEILGETQNVLVALHSDGAGYRPRCGSIIPTANLLNISLTIHDVL